MKKNLHLRSESPGTNYRLFLSVLFFLMLAAPSWLHAQTPEVLYYRFDEMGTTVQNLATSPPSGTETADILGGNLSQGGEGQCGSALIGTGSSSSSNYVDTHWAPDLVTSSWTIAFWINNVPNYEALWYIFGDLNTGSLRCFTNGVAGADNYWLRGPFTDVPVPGGAAAGPQHIAFVYDNVAANIKAYLNGVLVNTIAQPAINLTGSGPLKVGGYSTNSGLAPGSLMDEFRLYNRALSESEVINIYSSACGCYADADNDSYGDALSDPLESMNGTCPEGYVTNNLDCNDNDDAINPEAVDICDDIDNDCDGIADNGDDADGDGYTFEEGDCDDCNPDVNPGIFEICGNDIDDNCNGQTDEIPNNPEYGNCAIFYGFSPFQDSVWTVDTTLSFAITERRAPTLSGFTVTGVNSGATHPLTGAIYVIAKVSGVSGRVLCIFNPADATLTSVGNLGDNFSSITFSPTGQLFGVTGDGASVPETLYDIDPANAAKTLLTGLGNGADGEVICYNPDDNMIYHWSGNGTVVFEKVLPVAPYTVTGIPINGATSGETFGAAYVGNGKFLISNISSAFNYIKTDGTWSPAFGSLPDDFRGLPFLRCNVTCYADADADGYGDPNAPQEFEGVCSEGYVANNLDCNDESDGIYPCAPELCDGLDNDCNGMTDDGVVGGFVWNQEDVGNANGSATFPNCKETPEDVFTINATGFSTSTSDVLHMVYQDLCGNGEIIAHIVSITGGGWAGIAMRETGAQGSKKVALKAQLNGNIRREIRSATNGPASNLNYFKPQHSWLRLVRSGSIFSGYTSIDGVTWSFAFSATVSMNNCIQVGLFSESINANVTTTAVFDNVSVTGGVVPLAAPTNGFTGTTITPDFLVYPNPSNGKMTIDLGAYGDRSVRLELYNAQGAIVKTMNLDAAESITFPLDLTAFPDGVYLLRGTTDGIPDATKRIIISNNNRP